MGIIMNPERLVFYIDVFNPDFAIAKSAHRDAPSLCALGALIVEKLIIEKESEKSLYLIIKKEVMGRGSAKFGFNLYFGLKERGMEKILVSFKRFGICKN